MGNKQRTYKRTLKGLREVFSGLKPEVAAKIAAKHADRSERERKAMRAREPSRR